MDVQASTRSRQEMTRSFVARLLCAPEASASSGELLQSVAVILFYQSNPSIVLLTLRRSFLEAVAQFELQTHIALCPDCPNSP